MLCVFKIEGGVLMAKCAVCGKGVHFGNAVSHSHRRSNKIWKSNLKSVKVKVNGGTKKQYVCTSCLRSGKVERAQDDFWIIWMRFRWYLDESLNIKSEKILGFYKVYKKGDKYYKNGFIPNIKFDITK